MVNRPRFKDACHTYEPVNQNISPGLIEDYIRLEAEKSMHSQLGQNERIVYDSIEWPSVKRQDGTQEAPYIDENDAVEVQ